MKKKEFLQFNKEVEMILVEAGATVKDKYSTTISYSLPSYNDIPATVSLHLDFTRGLQLYSIFVNSEQFNEYFEKELSVKSYNTKTNIHTFEKDVALMMLKEKIKIIQKK